MGNWVDELVNNMEDAEARKRHIGQVMPDKAREFWNRLKKTLQLDIEKLNNHFSQRIGKIEIRLDDPSAVKIVKADFPAYYVHLFYGQGGIKIQREVVTSPSKSKSFQDHQVTFGLDQWDNLQAKLDDVELDEPTAVNHVSEFSLKAIVLGEMPSR
jgi:hypothetical protein